MDSMVQEWLVKANDKLIDAYCRISVEEYCNEYGDAFEINDKTSYNEIRSYMVFYEYTPEYVKFFKLLSDRHIEQNVYKLLHAAAEEELNIKILFLVPAWMLNITKDALEKQVEYGIKSYELLMDEIDDRYALLTISDQHKEYYCGYSYLKVLANGQLKIVEEDVGHYKFNIYYLVLNKELLEDVKHFINTEILRRIKARYALMIDDRCFMSAFRLEYHLAWMGKDNTKNDIDLYDYFEDKHSAEIIQRIMELPLVREHFSNIEAKRNNRRNSE